MFSSHPPPTKAPQRLTRWLVLLATCAAPLLAQASNCTSPNANADYILGAADGTASAMHWPTGLVWKRCVEGMTFNSVSGQCTGTATVNNWHTWANAYLPQPFANQANWGVDANYSQNRLVSGDWRMAYQNGWVSWDLTSELSSTIQNCVDAPKVNHTVFPNTPSALFVWSGSPSAGAPYAAWSMGFSNGYVGSSYRTDDYHVRLVRAGQPFAALTSPAAQTGAAGATVTFPAFTLTASDPTGQAWGGARISGAGSPAFRVNNTGDWVQEAIVKSGDTITVRLTAPATGGNTATFTLRSGQTTGTNADGSNGGHEATAMVETEATFTASPRYTKIANNGTELPDTAPLGTAASDWACTRDNATGKIWEIKTDDNGLRDKDYSYTWYDSNPFTNGGTNGASSGTTNCATTGRCDTEKYAQDVNAIGLCGATDWRMPSKDELEGIVDMTPSAPKINHDFFPNTPSTGFWSGSPSVVGVNTSPFVDFFDGGVYYMSHDSTSYVRLVRAGEALAPVLTAPAVSSITQTSASVQATSNRDGTGYWLVLPSGSAALTQAQIQAHANVQSVAMTADTPAPFSLSGLDANTAYELYFAAYDPVSTQWTPVQKTPFTTAPAPVAGACGSVAASATEPTTGLCSAGTATPITGSNGQWTWACNGLYGGSNTAADACAAPYASQTLSISASLTTIIVGATSAISASSDANLAVTLTPSGDCTLSGNTATGTAVGTCTVTASQAGTGDDGASRYLAATDATATITVNPVPINGTCGSSNGSILTSAPVDNLCSAGEASQITRRATTWEWLCSGLHYGTSATCEATHGYTVTPSTGPGGSISPSTAQTVASGSTTSFTVTADTGYQASATGCGGSLSGNSFTTAAITQDCAVSASFLLLPALDAATLSVVGSPTHYSASVQITSNQDSTIWWLAVPQGSAAPTAQQVKDGADYGAVIVAAHGHEDADANTPVELAINDLDPSTSYDLYLVAEAVGQLSEVAGPLSFSTAAAPISAMCGSADGVASATAPVANLCSAGAAGSVTGHDGSWTWVCNGLHGGSTHVCAAPYASQTLNINASPATILVGATSTISASSNAGLPVTLTPSGDCSLNGSTATGIAAGSCSITASQLGTGDSGTYRYLAATDAMTTITIHPVPINGACGSSNGSIFTSAPATNLCNAGDAGAVTESASTWGWTCSGLHNGSDATCEATHGYTVTPSAGTGGSISPSTAQTVAYNATTSFTVTADAGYQASASGCGGSLSGDSFTTASITQDCAVSASFLLLPALDANTLSVVGNPTHHSANVQATSNQASTIWWLAVPQGSAAPTAQQVQDGADYGAVVVAAHGHEDADANTPVELAINDLDPSTSYDLYLVAEAVNQLSEVTGPLSFSTAAAPISAMCGSADGVASATAPVANLCSAGAAGSVTGHDGSWTWVCNGLHGGSTHVCAAPYASQTLSISASPTTITVGATSAIAASSDAGLMVTLTPSGACSLNSNTATGTAVGTCTLTASQTGTGDTGTARYLPATDAAVALTVNAAPVNGACGGSHGGILTSAPATNLCSAGDASAVTGTGPWTWTCNGQNNGSNASCTASLQTWAVTASATQGGSASCAPATVQHGGTATCTATANAGYRFTGWTGACAGQNATCTLAAVAADQASTAQFAQTQNTLTVPEGEQAGQLLTVQALPVHDWQLTQASTQTLASLQAPDLPAGVRLPLGVVSLRLELGAVGSTAQVVLTYPEALPPGTVYYKYGRTQDNQQPHWYVFDGATISGNTITLTLTDGGAGDDDLLVNGVIADPGGPAVVDALAPVQPAPIPTLGAWALMLLSGLLGVLGVARRRRVEGA